MTPYEGPTDKFKLKSIYAYCLNSYSLKQSPNSYNHMSDCPFLFTLYFFDSSIQ